MTGPKGEMKVDTGGSYFNQAMAWSLWLGQNDSEGLPSWSLLLAEIGQVVLFDSFVYSADLLIYIHG